ncbi:ABC transporter permease, partial [Kingella kingae]|nr:ABC transporter permease [Kingella kingae]
MNFENLNKLLPDFKQAIVQTLTMVGVSATVSVILGGLLGVWLFTSGYEQIFANRPIHRTLGTAVS